jgi:hypothetical protein
MCPAWLVKGFRMFHSSARKFFAYGLGIAAAEEFITQGVLKDTYFLWVRTLIPFAVLLAGAWCAREIMTKHARGWRPVALYYLISGDMGLALEWFIIGLSPWKDTTSPIVLVALFHAGMFSFWGTVPLAPYILIDGRPEIASLKRRFVRTFAVLMGLTYVVTLGGKVAGVPKDLVFLASILLVISTFLTMNVFYVQYFRSCGH